MLYLDVLVQNFPEWHLYGFLLCEPIASVWIILTPLHYYFYSQNFYIVESLVRGFSQKPKSKAYWKAIPSCYTCQVKFLQTIWYSVTGWSVILVRRMLLHCVCLLFMPLTKNNSYFCNVESRMMTELSLQSECCQKTLSVLEGRWGLSPCCTSKVKRVCIVCNVISCGATSELNSQMLLLGVLATPNHTMDWILQSFQWVYSN